MILNTGKEENIHFTVSRRIFKQTGRTISRQKEQVAIKFLMTVLLFGLFAGKSVRFSVFQTEVRPPFFKSIWTKKNSKKKEQSATVPKDVYCYRYCFLETKECMHNEVGTCVEILLSKVISELL